MGIQESVIWMMSRRVCIRVSTPADAVQTRIWYNYQWDWTNDVVFNQLRIFDYDVPLMALGLRNIYIYIYIYHSMWSSSLVSKCSYAIPLTFESPPFMVWSIDLNSHLSSGGVSRWENHIKIIHQHFFFWAMSYVSLAWLSQSEKGPQIAKLVLNMI